MSTKEVRARYLTSSTPEGDGRDALLVTLTVAELSAVVGAVVSRVLDERDEREGTAQGGRLLDRAELAEKLECSVSLVDKSRRAGMPCSYLGDSPRFDLGECRRWLRSQRREEP